MNLSIFLVLFLLLAAIWVFSTIIHVKFLAKSQMIAQITSNSTIQNSTFIISVVHLTYYGIFIVISIGLLIFAISNGNTSILFISVIPILLVFVMIFWGYKKYATYADQLSIILLFLFFSLIFVPMGMAMLF